MAKTEQITLTDGITVEVDVEACSRFGFRAGDQIMPRTSTGDPATLLGVAAVPDNMRADCVPRGQELLWVRATSGKVCFIPPSLVEDLIKVD